jgi:hypothetical protein
MPNIDIDANDARVQYTANASQTVFNYDFVIFDQEDIVVIINGTTLDLTTDYTVTGVANESGGTVVLVSGTAGGELVTIFRDTAPKRESQYQADGIFDAAPFERDLDTIITILQEHDRDLARSVKLDIESTLSQISLPLPDANKVLVWNAGGTNLENGPSAADLTSATSTAVAAASAASSSASSASGSASAASTSALLAQSWAIDDIGDRPEGSSKYWSEQAEAWAQTVNLPALGSANTVLKVNGAGNALEYGLTAAANITSGAATSGQVLTANGSGGVSFTTIRDIPQNSQSAAYTLALSDLGKHILHPSADTTARTWTIPANSSVAFPIGTAVTFVNQNGAGVITIAITSDTLRLSPQGTTGSRTLAANGVATALKVTATEWIISGSGLT